MTFLTAISFIRLIFFKLKKCRPMVSAISQEELEGLVRDELADALYEKICFLKTIKFDENLVINHKLESNLFQTIHRELIGVYSNCHGTTLFLTGTEKEIIGIWERDIITNQNFQDLAGFFNYAFPVENERMVFVRPGAVGVYLMDYFLHNKTEKTDKKNASIVSFYKQGGSYSRPTLCHSALYLGEREGLDIIYHQENTKKLLRFSTVAEYESQQKRNEDYASDVVLTRKFHRLKNN
jgi:hypothetical protein